MLIDQVVPRLSSRGYKVAIMSNEVVSNEDANSRDAKGFDV